MLSTRFLGFVCCLLLCANVSAKEKTFLVLRVIDGDTIQIEGGALVRYIGIDTPELRKRVDQRWKYDPEVFGLEAKRFNAQLVEGKPIQLEFDVQRQDKYQRLLAYVYVDGVFVNEEMIKQGYARLLTIPPNVKYVERFRKASKGAKREKRGMWQ